MELSPDLRAVETAEGVGTCEADPRVEYVIDSVFIGNPRREMAMVLSWSDSELVTTDRPWAESQTLKLPQHNENCNRSGRDVLYMGNGMCIHSLVSVSGQPRPRTPGAGILGILPRKDTGIWTQGVGWRRLSAYFGDVNTPGWLMWNSSIPHPFTKRSVERALHLPLNTSQAITEHNTFQGFSIPRVAMKIGGNTWTRPGRFVPDYPFIDLPPDIYDSVWQTFRPNVHDKGDKRKRWMKALEQTTVQLASGGPIIRIDASALELAWQSPDFIDDMNLLVFRRAVSGTSVITFGCRPFRMNIFLDQDAGEWSLARVPDVEKNHEFNLIVGFVLLSTLVILYISSTTTRAIRRSELNVDESERPIQGRPTPLHMTFIRTVHQGWEMEAIELAIAIVALVVVVVNVNDLDLAERYAFLMYSDIATGELFASITFHAVVAVGSIQLLTICGEVLMMLSAESLLSSGSAELTSTQDPLSALEASRHPSTGKSFIVRVCRTIRFAVVPMTLFAPSHSVSKGTMSVWNFHVKFREFCTYFLVMAGYTCCLVRGVRNGTNIQILAAVCIVGIYMIGAETGKLIHIISKDVVDDMSSWSNRLQCLLYIDLDLACLVYMLVFLVRPIGITVFPVFSTSTLLIIAALIALGLYGGALLYTTGGHPSTKKNT